MSLIRDRKENATGSYERVLGIKELGSLISKVHAIVISNGTELEKYILENTTARVIDNVEEFKKLLNHNLNDNNNVFLIKKKIVKKSKVSKNNKEPDFIIIKKFEKELDIIELKEGWVFDTKKARGEFNDLKLFEQEIATQISYKTKTFICSFHQNNKSKIKEGFKNEVPIENIMNGI